MCFSLEGNFNDHLPKFTQEDKIYLYLSHNTTFLNCWTHTKILLKMLESAISWKPIGGSVNIWMLMTTSLYGAISTGWVWSQRQAWIPITLSGILHHLLTKSTILWTAQSLLKSFSSINCWVELDLSPQWLLMEPDNCSHRDLQSDGGAPRKWSCIHGLKAPWLASLWIQQQRLSRSTCGMVAHTHWHAHAYKSGPHIWVALIKCCVWWWKLGCDERGWKGVSEVRGECIWTQDLSSAVN